MLRWKLYGAQCYAVHCTLHAVRCALHTVRCALHTVRCALHGSPAPKASRGSEQQLERAALYSVQRSTVCSVQRCVVYSSVQRGAVLESCGAGGRSREQSPAGRASEQ